MPRTQEPPKYRRHKASGQAIVTLSDGLGNRRDVLLGTYNSAASRIKYNQTLAEWEARGRQVCTAADPATTVAELVARFWMHAKQHYRSPDGTVTNEVDEYKRACRPLCHLYGQLPARDFGPLALKAVRELMVSGYEHPKYGTQEPLARGVVNQRTGRVRRVFRWAVENELVPVTVLQSLQAVKGLQKGRTEARETEPVKPVAVAIVEQTLPYLNRFLAGLARLQLLTGARPGELIIMRPCDLDTTGEVWLYRPGSDRGPEGQHKTAYRGKQRIIAIGPRAQEVLRPLLPLATQDYVFSAVRAMEEYQDRRRANRKSPLTPSQQARQRRRTPRKRPGAHYSVTHFAHAVAKVCADHDIPHWHPHQLRHTNATQVRRQYGLEAAQVTLGHSSAQVSEVYAERNQALAEKVAREIG